MADNLAAASARVKQDILAASRDVLSGRYSALGADWPLRDPGKPFSPTIWRLDPVTGGLWPGSEVYCFDIPYRHERMLGDIKYVWEYNRLQFLQPLAADAALTGNPDAIAAIEAAIGSWYEANPPFRGICWNSGIELGLRAISLLVVTSLCGDRLSDATVEKIRTILHAHQVWMARYPSRFSSANNHLVAEVAGEFLISLAMPELPLSGRLQAKGRKILAEEANKQILADGVGAEQSPTYGAFTAEFLLLCCFAARAAGQPLAKGIEERLALFSTFIAWLSDAKGRTPGICDDDEGRVITLSRHEPAYATSVSAAIAGYLGTPAKGPRPPEIELRDALLRAPVDSPAPPSGLRTFAQGGYTVVREARNGRDLHIVVDHAPLGYLSIAAHGHADALSVIVTVDGKPLFVDPGTYLYHSGGEWRDWFRSTRAHNTLTLAGADQSMMSGAFNWSHKAVASLDSVEDGENWRIVASHDGYRNRFGCLHRRTVASTPHGFSIHDALTGNPDQAAEIVFQLSPNCEVEMDGQEIRILSDKHWLATMSFSHPGRMESNSGGQAGTGGWHSPRFGIKLPAPRIAWKGTLPSEGLLTNVQLVPEDTE
ncbi:alginate lyase family protein [Shinella zoogloeoides]|uniref:heparinase II/III family protein n=1 Tax=Shinella zoogloeoides TaxID=352475 RepID=UPI0028ACA79C|nr:alginate lyase family protein [Shinella zoogloeoides]